jgi:hypothetical protein
MGSIRYVCAIYEERSNPRKIKTGSKGREKSLEAYDTGNFRLHPDIRRSYGSRLGGWIHWAGDGYIHERNYP